MNPIFLTLLALSLFSQKEGKEKKELHNNAETAFAHSDYTMAKKAYGELFKKMDKPQDDWQNYIDIVVRFAEVHLLLKEYKEGEELLVSLLNKNPPAEFMPRITVLLGRICSFQEKAGTGYVKMQEASLKVPLSKWRPEERSFFHAVEYALNAYYENLLQKAKHFAAASSYKEAIDAYETIVSGIKLGYFPNAVNNSILQKKVLFRLAESHFLSANFEKTLTLANSIVPPSDELDAEMLFLAALCYKEKREYEKAILCFQNYLVSSDSPQFFHYDSALFELGQFYYRNGNLQKAKEYLEKLTQNKENLTRPALVGAVSLGRIYLLEKQELQTQQAEALFLFVLDHLKNDDPLYFESTFLLGEIAFEKKLYRKASHFFELALIPTGLKGDWTKSALYKLALCYISQQDETLSKKGEGILEQFINHEFHEEIALALGDHYVAQKNVAKFDELRTKVAQKLSENGKGEFALLRCTLASSFEEKDAILQTITDGSLQLSNELIAKGLYYQALNDLDKIPHDHETKDLHIRKAIANLEKAQTLVGKYDDVTASQLLHLEIRAHLLLKDQLLALSLIQKLNHDQGINGDPLFHEKLYLKALLLTQMDSLEYKMLAAKIFEEIVSEHPESKYADDALFALGTFYYKLENYAFAKKSFRQLIESYPSSPYQDESYFWAAETAEKQGEEKESNDLRRLCFEKFPFSTKAPEAYFKCYTIEQYLEGGEKALAHISSFPSLFPSSHLLPIAYFLIGYHERSYPIAKGTLEKALELFSTTDTNARSMTAFRHRTMLELALLDVRYAQDMSYALKMLLNLVSELQDLPEDMLASQKGVLYSPIYEESEFALFQIYRNLKKDTLAYEVLLSMLKHYSEAGITEGFYLSEVWKEQGILAFDAKDFTTALSCIQVAMECGEKYLNDEQRFSLQLLQSDCYRAQGSYDQAMRALSQVINEEIDSHLRLKAMFLRAEIYELQGREELSIRQLISLAKLEGKWSLQAKEKLRKVYGISI